ncbi:MAG: hypothetical protein QOI41_237 [Myxococcales bacterium]|nr:hypothetical protein [Myxococcales bacterium]
MWTESRYPNNAALMARPLLLSAASAEAELRVGYGACDRSSSFAHTTRSTFRAGLALTSGGKVTPADGQEHPRTEL